MAKDRFRNPFRPGAGHMPPYLAGREAERQEFQRFIAQDRVLENVVLTGLRGVGKTVLLETFKPLAISEGWLWVGADLSEAASVTEDAIATRLLTDLAVITSRLPFAVDERSPAGFERRPDTRVLTLNFGVLSGLYGATPGLASDKVKAVLREVWVRLDAAGKRGVVFAYDEAQTLADHAGKEQYPLSLLLDVFQAIQREGIPFLLVLTGLPTLFPKLVEARTFSERMFRVIELKKLDREDTRQAILKPIAEAGCPVQFDDASVDMVWRHSGGYPYFIQYICRDAYDAFLQRIELGCDLEIPIEEIIRRLDRDFFAGRWARATDRQRELLHVIARLGSCDEEFTVQEIVEESKRSQGKPFSASHASQMLAALGEHGLVYKNRHGRYSLAIPLLSAFIRRLAEAS